MKLIGLARIGNEPELRYTSSNMAVLQLSLAYAYGKEKATQWVSASLFGKRAEALSQYLAKGQLIYAEVSEIHIDIFTGKDGKERTSLKGIVQEVGLTGKSEPAKAEARTEAPRPVKSQSIEEISDDIPF
jgi:single-strand DNA-binding protein